MNEEIEVILSDDCSTESYQDIVDQYKDILSIKQIRTDYNFAPGNTREKGASIAEGVWLAFADHDDEYVPNTLLPIKNALIASGEQYYGIANFYEADPETKQVLREMVKTRNWNHAKFYNLDNFWKAYNIHFRKDLLTHEDICVSSQVNVAIYKANRDNPTYIDSFCYIWNNRPTSISRERYGNHHFLEVFYDDYITSTGRVYLEAYQNGVVDRDYAIDCVLEVMGYCYNYMQGFKFHDPEGYIRDNEEYARKFYTEIKETFGITNKFAYDWLAQNDAEKWMAIRASAEIGSGPCIPTDTYKEWLDILHKDMPERVTMSDAMHKENK
jgi:glycosyltransferase involved in cell wall biosynthesis